VGKWPLSSSERLKGAISHQRAEVQNKQLEEMRHEWTHRNSEDFPWVVVIQIAVVELYNVCYIDQYGYICMKYK